MHKTDISYLYIYYLLFIIYENTFELRLEVHEYKNAYGVSKQNIIPFPFTAGPIHFCLAAVQAKYVMNRKWRKTEHCLFFVLEGNHFGVY